MTRTPEALHTHFLLPTLLLQAPGGLIGIEKFFSCKDINYQCCLTCYIGQIEMGILQRYTRLLLRAVMNPFAFIYFSHIKQEQIVQDV